MTTDLNQNTPQLENPEEKSFFGIIVHSFFVVPFLIAVFCVLLFAAVRILTMEQHTIYDYLSDVKTGSLTKRWQSAFELSKLMADPKRIPKEGRFINEMTSVFVHSKNDDDRVRQYLALAMGRTGDIRFAEPLLAVLSDEKPENLYAVIYALGMLKSNAAVKPLEKFLEHPDARIRFASVVALGNIADLTSINSLKKTLFDAEPNVQWDAAIALAKMKDVSGKNILLKLLDRRYLSKFPEVDSAEQTHVLLITIDVASQLHDHEIDAAIVRLQDTDQNMNVRKVALDAIKK